jgi:hypothetical protein
LQIISGGGRVLFYLDRDGVDEPERLPLHVLIHMEGGASSRKEVVLSTAGKFVTLKVPGSRVLKKKHLTSGGPIEPGSAGRVRYRYFDQTGAENWKVEGIAVGIGPPGAHKVITRFNRADLGDAILGTQVMIWFDEV